MDNNQKLILLVGMSGSGKTSIAKELEKLGYNVIHSYTTREPREENEWGHIFVKKNIGHIVKKSNDMIAFKNLYDYEYWATKDQYQEKGTSIYVIDPEGAEQIRKNIKDAEIITIFISVYWENCRNRMFLDSKRSPKAVLERVKSDRELFKTCKCDYVVDGNFEVKDTLESIKEIIERG